MSSLRSFRRGASRKRPTRTPFVPQQCYWNGEKAIARHVRVRVDKDLPPGWWCAGLEGTIRRAVAVTYGGETFYLDNEDGSGWLKVTVGRGSPGVGHRSLPVSEVLEV